MIQWIILLHIRRVLFNSLAVAHSADDRAPLSAPPTLCQRPCTSHCTAHTVLTTVHLAVHRSHCAVCARFVSRVCHFLAKRRYTALSAPRTERRSVLIHLCGVGGGWRSDMDAAVGAGSDGSAQPWRHAAMGRTAMGGAVPAEVQVCLRFSLRSMHANCIEYHSYTRMARIQPCHSLQ